MFEAKSEGGDEWERTSTALSDYRTLRLRSVPPDATIRELLQLLTGQNFHPADICLDLIGTDLSRLQVFIGMPRTEAVAAWCYMNELEWKGQKLNATLYNYDGRGQCDPN